LFYAFSQEPSIKVVADKYKELHMTLKYFFAASAPATVPLVEKVVLHQTNPMKFSNLLRVDRQPGPGLSKRSF
jgi:hypothetical protein